MGSDTDLPRRKTIRHFDRPLQPRLLTFSCAQRRPLLLDDTHRSIVCDAIHRAARTHRIVILAWVLMPEHVHLLCLPWHGASEISALLKAIKRPSSYRIKQHLEQTNEALAQSLTVRTQPGTSFRFWQSGPGHDSNIRSQPGLIDAISYVHNNPVRRQLVPTPSEWRWSSARQWTRQEDVTPPLPVVLWYPTRGLDWEGPEAWFATEQHE